MRILFFLSDCLIYLCLPFIYAVFCVYTTIRCPFLTRVISPFSLFPFLFYFHAAGNSYTSPKIPLRLPLSMSHSLIFPLSYSRTPLFFVLTYRSFTCPASPIFTSTTRIYQRVNPPPLPTPTPFIPPFTTFTFCFTTLIHHRHYYHYLPHRHTLPFPHHLQHHHNDYSDTHLPSLKHAFD